MNFDILKNAVLQSHIYAESVIQAGDTVVDATIGNGNDTVFLAKKVGSKGIVYGFDIQQRALDNTRKKLSEKALLSRVNLILSGHQFMDRYVKTSVKVVMFNLGYLPGGDHSISTKPDTTIAALQKALELLEVRGLAIVVIYHGGDTGFEERDCLLNWLKRIDNRRFKVMKTEFINLPNNPPILVCIEKIS